MASVGVPVVRLISSAGLMARFAVPPDEAAEPLALAVVSGNRGRHCWSGGRALFVRLATRDSNFS